MMLTRVSNHLSQTPKKSGNVKGKKDVGSSEKGRNQRVKPKSKKGKGKEPEEKESDERTVVDGVESEEDNETSDSDESFKTPESDSEESGNVKRKKDAGSSEKGRKVIKTESKMVKPKSKKGKGKGPKERKERRKVPCPLLACKSQVTHLPRHMRNVHKWTEEASRKVLSKYNIRKRKSPKKSPKKKDYHRRRRCPVSQCQSIVFRLTQHLKKVHKMKRSSTEFRDALENARVVPDIKHPLLRKKDERAKKRSVLLTDWNRPSTSAAYHEGDSSDKINEQAKKTSVLMTDWNRPSTSAAYHEDDSSDDKISDCPARRSDESTNEQIAKNPVILKFEEWMLSPDGGKRDAKTAKQHSSQVFGMLKAIDDEEDMHSLLDLALVRNVFLKSHVVTKKLRGGNN